MIQRGSYAECFAPRDFEAEYPALWQSCIGRWAPHLGPSGAQLLDWAGRKNHGTLTNMSLASAWDLVGGQQALTLDGVDDFVAIPARASLAGAAQATIEGWIRPTSVSHVAVSIIYIEQTSSSGFGRISGQLMSTGQLRFQIRDSAADPAGTALTFSSSATVTLNEWQHVAFVYDSIRDVHTIWLNGKIVATDTSARAALGTSTTNAIGIGQTASNANPYRGQISELGIYDRDISAIIPQLASARGMPFVRRRRRVWGAPFFSPGLSRLNLATTNPGIVRGAATVSPISTVLHLASTSPTIRRGSVTIAPTSARLNLASPGPRIVRGSVAISAVAGLQFEADDLMVVRGSMAVTPGFISIEFGVQGPGVVRGNAAISPGTVKVELLAVSPWVVRGSLSVSPSASTLDLATVDPSIHRGAVTETPAVSQATLATAGPNVVRGDSTISPIAARLFLGTLVGVSRVQLSDGWTLSSRVSTWRLTERPNEWTIDERVPEWRMTLRPTDWNLPDRPTYWRH